MRAANLLRRSRKSSSNRSGPELEALEPRLLLSGNVTGMVSGGSLILIGDNASNEVLIDGLVDALPDGSDAPVEAFFAVSGSGGTTINGAPSQMFEGVTRDIRVRLRGGDDALWVVWGAVPGNLNIDAGSGNDRVSVDHFVVGRSLYFRGRRGEDAVEMLHSPVGGDVYIHHYVDGGSSTIRDSAIGRNVRVAGWGADAYSCTLDGSDVGGSFSFGGGHGDDVVELLGSTIGRSAYINHSTGKGSTTVRNAAVDGSLYVVGGGAEDQTCLLDGSAVGWSFTFRGGRGSNTATVTATTIERNLLVSSYGTGDAVTVADGTRVGGTVRLLAGRGGGDFSIRDSRIDRDLRIHAGRGDDVVDLFALDLGGGLTIATGSGDDEVRIDDSNIGRATSINTGGGGDRVNLETRLDVGPKATTFAGNVRVATSYGDDTVLLDCDPQGQSCVVFLGSVLFHGGWGYDSITTNGTAGLDETNCRSFEEMDFSPPDDLVIADSATDLERLVAGNNAFAFDLYQALRSAEGNLFYSPLSISTALAMTYAGARGRTAEQMADTLRFLLPQETLHATFGQLIEQLTREAAQMPGEEVDPVTLSIANALWGQVGYPFLPGFLGALADGYGSGLRRLDFVADPDRCREIINQWVSDKTFEKIKDVLKQGDITVLTRLVLANALYFKGSWQYSFFEEATQPEVFHADDGDAMVDMMRQWETLRYAEGSNYQAVELPYVGGNMSMVVLLPAEGAFDEFEQSLTSAAVDAIVSDLSTYQVNLSLPKFECEQEILLNGVLAGMGMVDAFISGVADLSGMDGTRDLYISRARHKAWIEVNEAGTEAAAATVVVVSLKGVDPTIPRATFTADRPFIYMIRDMDTNTTLFVGRVCQGDAFES